MEHLTIRDIPEDLARALVAEKERSGWSLNRTVKELLRRSLGLTPLPFDNGLGRFAGTWSEAHFVEFERATAIFEQIDEEQWK